jgi:hypothetical protein
VRCGFVYAMMCSSIHRVSVRQWLHCSSLKTRVGPHLLPLPAALGLQRTRAIGL